MQVGDLVEILALPNIPVGYHGKIVEITKVYETSVVASFIGLTNPLVFAKNEVVPAPQEMIDLLED